MRVGCCAWWGASIACFVGRICFACIHKQQRPLRRVGVVVGLLSQLVKVEALGAVEIALDAALGGLDELLAVDDDVCNLLV